jgi:hypothetical protein
MKIEASVIDERLVAGFMCLKSIDFCYIGCQFSHAKSAVIACVRTLRAVIVVMFACIHVICMISRELRMSGRSLISYRAPESLSVLTAIYRVFQNELYSGIPNATVWRVAYAFQRKHFRSTRNTTTFGIPL